MPRKRKKTFARKARLRALSALRGLNCSLLKLQNFASYATVKT